MMDLGYTFNDESLLEIALTHSSYANENGVKSNERLEFLGDAVLQLAMSEILFKRESDKEEGDLTRLRSSFVCDESLYNYAVKANISKEVKLGYGLENNNLKSPFADAVEAIIGAIFLDSDYETARDFIENNLSECSNVCIKDAKSELKELLEKQGIKDIDYVLINEAGKDNDKIFTVQCIINGKVMGKGKARKKKDAEKIAAHEALHSLKE